MDDGRIIIKAEIDTSSFDKDAEKLKKRADEIKYKLSTMDEGDELNDLEDELEDITDQLRNMGITLDDVSDVIDDLEDNIDDVVDAFDDISDSANDIHDVADAIEVVSDKSTVASKNIDTVDVSIKSVTKSTNNLSSILKGVGITALVTKATQTAVKFAKEVNTATEAVSAKLKAASTLYQGVSVDQEKLLSNLSSIASKTGADLETLGQSVYDALSAGVKPTEDMADVLKVVEASAKLAKGGFTDTSTALSSTMKVMNAYSLEMKDLDRVQGILVQTQNSGITTVDELGASLAQVVPTAASFGVSFENVGAAIAEMTKQGTKTAQATTSLNAIIAELGKNGTTASKNLIAAAEASGMADTDFQSLLDSGMNLSEILQLMSDYASANGLSMVDMFSSIEAGKGALQLTGKAGEDFNAIMDSMQESAGLVQEAFEKTVDPSERLNTAWNNMLVIIGSKYKGEMDNVRTALADMIMKMSCQITTLDTLKTSYSSIETALSEYKTAQKEAETNTNDLTLAIEGQKKAALELSLQNQSETYRKALKEQEKLTNYHQKQVDLLEGYKSQITEFADLMGVSYEELYKMTDKERMDAFGNSSKTTLDYIATINELIGHIPEAVYNERDAWLDLQNNLNDQQEFINILTQAYLEENDSAKLLLDTYPQIKNVVLGNVDAYKELQKAKEDAADADGGSGAGAGNGVGSDIVQDVEETKYSLEDLVKEINSVHESYENMDKAKRLTSESFYEEGDKLEELRNLYVKALKNGINPYSQAMQDLYSEIKKLTPAEEEEATAEEELASKLSDTVDEYNKLTEAGDKMNVSMADAKTYADSLRSMMAEYVLKGVDPASDAMQDLVGWINKFDDIAESSKTTVSELEQEFKDFAKTSAKSFAQGIGSGLEEFAESLASQEDRLEEIDKQLNEIGDETSGQLKDAIDDITDAEQELAIATERGDTVAIANAQKKVDKAKQLKDSLDEQVSTLKTQRKEVETGADSWKMFGKSALESLASVIEGLAAQLAAMAISTYPNVGQMIASASGSAAAYIAAGLIRSQAQRFENGGIVKGTSYTGDRTWIRANAGELIMNMAQQETMARILEASVALAELNATNGVGGGITVNMEGSTIYGLDEPAVGKAIYENIEQLKYEGVI